MRVPARWWVSGIWAERLGEGGRGAYLSGTHLGAPPWGGVVSWSCSLLKAASVMSSKEKFINMVRLVLTHRVALGVGLKAVAFPPPVCPPGPLSHDSHTVRGTTPARSVRGREPS